MEAFKIFFAQDKVHPLLLVMFFSNFSQNKKSATQPPHPRSELPPHSSPWTPAAYDASMVLEEEEEDESDLAIEYVEHDGCWWGCEWVPALPAVLLVAGRCRWVPGWPYYLAASVAHRQQVTSLRPCTTSSSSRRFEHSQL